MSSIDGDSYACQRRAEIRQMHDLATLALEFFFFAGIAARKAGTDVRQNIKCNWMRIDLRLELTFTDARLNLLVKLSNRARARSGYGLIAGAAHALQTK